jgi:hypothetical protein
MTAKVKEKTILEKVMEDKSPKGQAFRLFYGLVQAGFSLGQAKEKTEQIMGIKFDNKDDQKVLYRLHTIALSSPIRRRIRHKITADIQKFLKRHSYIKGIHQRISVYYGIAPPSLTRIKKNAMSNNSRTDKWDAYLRLWRDIKTHKVYRRLKVYDEEKMIDLKDVLPLYSKECNMICVAKKLGVPRYRVQQVFANYRKELFYLYHLVQKAKEKAGEPTKKFNRISPAFIDYLIENIEKHNIKEGKWLIEMKQGRKSTR